MGIQALADFQQDTKVKLYQEMGFRKGEWFTLGCLHWLLLTVSWSFCRDSSAVCEVPVFSATAWLIKENLDGFGLFNPSSSTLRKFGCSSTGSKAAHATNMETIGRVS